MEQTRNDRPFSRKSLIPLVYLAAGLVLLTWLGNTPEGLLGKADAIGYAVCHRIDVRSFHLGDRPISLCARCTGMYLGALLGLAFQWFTAPRAGGFPPRRVIAVLAGVVVLFGIDGVNSFAHLLPNLPGLYEPNNVLRILTGVAFGIVMSAAIYPAFSQTMWEDWPERAALPGLRQLFIVFLLGLGIALLVLTENPFILYPLALISAAGVLVILSMVYGMLWLIVLKAENQYTRLWQLITPLTGGFAMALLQIALLDWGRFILTGTWEGFHVLLG
ncbi:MAG TPA: DUF2085 domain-containing protein [Anaerolineales bacterium]|nr:DUF2085 domain-containing protein [Anaerolineales bacterium]